MINRRKGNELECTVTEGEFPKATTAVVLYDRGCDWLDCYPKALRTTEETVKACQHFAGEDKIKSFYCDNAKELAGAALHLEWPMPTSTPGVAQTNGLAERHVGIAKDGTRTFIKQSGMHKSWSGFAAECFCFYRNTEGENSSYLRRHEVESNHLRIPHGALVDYMPTPVVGQEPSPFEPRTRTGLFLKPHVQPGGIFSGDYYVADFDRSE